MSALSDLYSYAQEEHIGIYAYPIEFRSAVSMRDGPRRATFFDFAKLTTTADICWAAAHENGHHHMGAYHKVDSPYQVWGQAEYRANHWAFEHYLSPAQLLEAFEAGYTETVSYTHLDVYKRQLQQDNPIPLSAACCCTTRHSGLQQNLPAPLLGRCFRRSPLQPAGRGHSEYPGISAKFL